MTTELRRGKLPARPYGSPGGARMIFGDYLSAAAPQIAVPKVFGNIPRQDGKLLVPEIGILGNDTTSNCVEVAMANASMLFGAIDGKPFQVTTTSVLSDYSAITGYDSTNPATDQGTDMAAAMAWWQATGVNTSINGERYKIKVHLGITPQQLELATFECRAVPIGLMLMDDAEDQFRAGKPWTLTTGAKQGAGHGVTVFGRNSSGLWVCRTWGGWQGISNDYILACMDEGYAPIPIGATPRRIDEAAMLADLEKYTGQKPAA